jgi:hypothetical protein
VLINADEETGSLSSAPLIARLAAGKAAALTYEPSALPDGTLAARARAAATIRPWSPANRPMPGAIPMTDAMPWSRRPILPCA